MFALRAALTPKIWMTRNCGRCCASGLKLATNAPEPMTPDQFRASLADLGYSQAGFARLAMVDARTVRRWCDGTRAVPGPVVALLGMMVKHEWREIALEG
jgi:DNA-binding transcriptional regulator YiaG